MHDFNKYFILLDIFILISCNFITASNNFILGPIDISVGIEMEILTVTSHNFLTEIRKSKSQSIWGLDIPQSFVGFNHSLSHVINLNIGQLLVIFQCDDKSEFEISVSNVVEFLRNNQRGRNWKPLFLLHYPDILSSQENLDFVIQDPLIYPLIKNGVVDTPVYILFKISGPNFTNDADKLSKLLIVEVYSIRNRNIIQEIILTDNPEERYTQIAFITSRRSNFYKGTVIAVAMDDPDYPLATEFKPNSTELIGGFEVEIYQYFRDALNFTESAVKGTGYLKEGHNGTITGHIVQINKGEGDVGIGAAEFLEYRVKGPQGLTYIHPTFYARVLAFFKQPPASSIRNIFIQTFTTELWSALFVIWILLLLILKIFIKLKRKLETNHQKDECLAEEYTIWAFGAICQQGWHISPYSTSIKIIFFFGVFTGLISFIAYSAALVSILSVEVVPIRVFDDLITERFHITSDNHIPTAKFVVKDLEDSHQIPKLGEEVRNIEIVDNFENLFKTRMAIVTIPDSFYPIIQQNYTDDFVCSTLSVKIVNSRPLKSSCFVRRGSPLREFLNYKLLVMQERGIKDRLIKHYILGTSILCLQSTSSKFQLQLGLRDLFTAFLIISSGLFLSLIIAFTEKLIFFRLMQQAELLDLKPVPVHILHLIN